MWRCWKWAPPLLFICSASPLPEPRPQGTHHVSLVQQRKLSLGAHEAWTTSTRTPPPLPPCLDLHFYNSLILSEKNPQTFSASLSLPRVGEKYCEMWVFLHPAPFWFLSCAVMQKPSDTATRSSNKPGDWEWCSFPLCCCRFFSFVLFFSWIISWEIKINMQQNPGNWVGFTVQAHLSSYWDLGWYKI